MNNRQRTIALAIIGLTILAVAAASANARPMPGPTSYATQAAYKLLAGRM